MFQQLNDVAEELPLLSKPRAQSHFVDDVEQLRGAITQLAKGEGPLAVDAERASGFKYSQRAYLVQLHRAGSPIYLIDPIAFSEQELSELASFTNEQTWILHAATQDLGCLAELGLRPRELFDTELISRLLGYPRVGLGAVCELALGLRLAKEHSAADWSTRPLPEDWLNYAALDVDVLPGIRNYLLSEIEAQEKQDLVAQEMNHLLGFKPKEQKADRWRSMSSMHELKEQRQLAIAQSLWEAREELAIRLDVSPGRLIPDRSIIHVAQTQPRSKSVMANDKAFNGRASRSYLDTWWAAFDAGLNARALPPLRVPATGIPNHRNWAGKFPEAHARLESAKASVAEVAETLRMPVENLLTPDYLRQLCWEPWGYDETSIANQLLSLGARKWQVELVSEPISRGWKSLPQGPNPTA
jgi:ribonuclease D